MAAHNRKRTYYSQTPKGMISRQMTRRQARRVPGYFPDRATAARMYVDDTGATLALELDRIAALGRDDAANNIPGRRNRNVQWLRDALAATARTQAA
jgi:hypothetical protein